MTKSRAQQRELLFNCKVEPKCIPETLELIEKLVDTHNDKGGQSENHLCYCNKI